MAAAPTLQVDAANIQLNSYSSSWTCDPQSDLSHGLNCHSQANIPVTYVFTYAPIVVQDPATGQYYFFSGGVSQDGGFTANDVRFDNLVSWEAAGPQGGTHVLREVNFEEDTPHNGLHNVLRSGFYDSTFGEFFWFDTIFESGAFSVNKLSGISILHGPNPTTPQNYDALFKAHRPTGNGSGAEYHFNKGALIKHPNSSTLWIGVMRAHHSVSGHNVITPILVDPSTETFWLHYTTEGWCPYPWGTEFTGFDLSETCLSGKSGGKTNTVIPDHFEGDTQWPFRYRGLANVDGKVILHGKVDTTRACGSDTSCMRQHALCPAEFLGFNHDLLRVATLVEAWCLASDRVG
jgi:hypothetical protein